MFLGFVRKLKKLCLHRKLNQPTKTSFMSAKHQKVLKMCSTYQFLHIIFTVEKDFHKQNLKIECLLLYAIVFIEVINV